MKSKQPPKKVAVSETAAPFKPENLHSLIKATVITDLEGTIHFWDKSATAIYGWTSEEAVGRKIIDLVPNDQTKEETIEIKNLVLQSESWSGECVVQRRNGESFPAFVTNLPYYNDAREVSGIVGISTDLTIEKKSAREMQMLLNNTEEAFILLDLQLNISSFNRQALHLYKKFMGKELAIGLPILQFASPERVSHLENVYKTVLNGTEQRAELPFNDEHGNAFIYEIKYCPAKNETGDVLGVFISSRNVTSQKKAAATLIANEAKWHALVENIHDIFMIINAAGCIEYLSPSVGTILGYPKYELLNKNFYDLFDGTDQKIMQQHFKNSLAYPGIKQQQDRIRIKHLSGEWLWVESSFTNLLENDNIRSVIFTARDITQLVESSAILAEEKRNKEALINATDDLVWSINENYEWITANEAFIKTLKLATGIDLKPGDNLMQKGKFADEWLILWESFYSRAFTGESFREEIFIPKNEFIKKDSWAEVNCDPIWSNGKLSSIACWSRDITDRKQQEEKEKELAVSQSLFSSIINNSEDAIISKSLDGIITSWNKAAVQMFGYTPEEALGKPITMLIPAEFIEEEVFILNKIRNKEPVYNYETERVDKSGVRKSVSVTVSPILNREGNVVGASKIARDISRQKKDAILLQQSEARLQGIISSQTNYIIRVDLEGKYAYYNDKFFQDFGWLHQGKSLIGLPAMESIMPYHHEVVAQTVSRCLARPNKVFQVEIDKPFLNNTVKTTLWDFICLTNQDGIPTEIQAVGIDIMKRVSAEKMLKQSLEEKNAVLESIGDAFFAVDKNWIANYWNKNAEIMLGIESENIIGKNIWKIFSKELYKKNYTILKNALHNNEIKHYEFFYSVTNGWYEVSIFPSEAGLSIYLKNITERKIASNLIIEANERYNLVSRATNDVIWDWNVLTGAVQRSAENMKRVFGYDQSSAIDNIDFWNSNIHPDDIERVTDKFDVLFNNDDESIMESEYQFKKADGTYAYVYDKGYIIRDATGKPQRLIGAVQDITRLKENEILIQEKAKELARSNKELEQFAFIASHDLQEPLRMVTSFLTQLQKNYKNSLDDRANNYINFAVDGAVRMRQIMLDLLEYSRVGRTTEDAEKVNMNEVVHEVMHLAQKKIEELDAAILFDNLPVVTTDKPSVFRLLQNLLMNALKFAKPGIAPKIEVAAEERSTEWVFSVKDNGIGIGKEYFDRIFILFQKLHNREEYSGNGIGLSIAKKIIETMGGNIWVESTEGEGATFFFTIKKV